MRKVPELRFDGFEGEWKEYRFNDITKLSQGLQIPIDKRYLQPSDDTYFYITNEFLKPGSKKHYYIKNPNKSVIANKDDILMTRTGNTGKVLTDVEGAFHNNFFKIAYDNSSISKYYLFYLLNSGVVQNKILRLAGSSTILDLNHKDFYSIDSSFPSLKEQRKIGKIFKNLDALIEIQEGKVAKLEDLKKSMLQKMFPKKGNLVPEFRFDGFDGEWKMDKLKNIINYRRGSFPQPYTEDSWYGGENSMPFVQVNDVATSSFKLKENTKNTISTIAMPKSVFVEKGTILVTIQGSIGRIALTQYDSYVDRTLLIITDNIIEFDKYFLINVLYLLFYKEKFKASGGTIKSITTKKLGDFKISFPSIEEQEKIGQFFKNLDTQIENEEKLLESYKMMKKSLLQKMFV